jgi:hypothetical protein
MDAWDESCLPECRSARKPGEYPGRLETMRRFRNDIAHHAAIFDRSPQKEFQNMIHITGLICTNTRWLAKQLSRLQHVINERPRI